MDVKTIFFFTTFLSIVGGLISFIFSKLRLPLLGGIKGALSNAISGGGLSGFNKKSAPGAGRTKSTPQKGRPMRSTGRPGGGTRLRGGGGKKWGKGLKKIKWFF